MNVFLLLAAVWQTWDLTFEEVTNPVVPKSGKSIELNLVKTVTSEEADVLGDLATNTDFALSPDGNLIILDSGNHRVLVLSPEGELLRTFGRSGQGPGEFEGATTLDVDAKGRIFVFDGVRRKCSIFSVDGTFERDSLLPNGLAAVIRGRIHPSGTIILSTLQMDENFQQTYALLLLDEQFQNPRVLAKVPLPPTDWAAMGQSGFFEDYLVQQFEALADGLPLGATCGSKIVAATSNVYSGMMYDGDGQLELEFSKKYKPVRYSDEAKESVCEAIWEGVSTNAPFGSQITFQVFQKALKRAEFPTFIPPISDIFSTDNGFGIMTSYDPVTEVGTLDLFDCGGVCIASGAYRGLYGVIRVSGNRLHVLGMGEEDEIEIHMFQMQGM